MFTIYRKRVGGQVFDRYYKEWDNAKHELLNELAGTEKDGWTIDRRLDYFNAEKGFYIFEVYGRTDAGERFTLALVDGYFRD